ncbi:helix-turn-helix domain-containing protein [Saccharothrix syringae]|uniref:XRE family transcriptional regulator n=1 Tax=Saccharothrix syringae TaxID=103733 RepID=A0A5Q0H8U4_SACSY|nr:helix-turn-helix transcriptional regulator [Saccharothrix syringae]QFZ22393.1 XRE family transcriptional regulator [Saccharothrix syringae]
MPDDRNDPPARRPASVFTTGPLPPLPPSLWEGREVREAVRNQSPGAVVAVARRAHGLRQDELGALAGFSQSAISRLESGSNIAYDVRVLRPLQRLLGIPAHLLGLAEETVPVEARRLRRSVPGFPDGVDGLVGVDVDALMALTRAAVFDSGPGGPVNPDAMSRLMVLRRVLNEAHDRRGSSPLMPTVRAMYEFVDALRRSARGEQRRELLGIAATYAEFFGWLHEESDDPRGARRWTVRALEQGQAADDRDVVAYAYVRMSRLAEADGDVDRVLGLARAASREPDLSPVVRAIALGQEARGLALAGDQACMDRLDRAAAEYARGEAPTGDEYRIGYCFTADHIEVERAACWLELGEPGRAIRVYEEVQQRLWRRMCLWEQGVHLAKLAHAHAMAGEAEQAVSLAYDALDAARATRSAQVLQELGRLGPWEGAPEVAELARGVR